MDHTIDLDHGSRLVLRGVDADGSAANCDLEVLDSDGTRWSATVLTLEEISRLMTSYENTGECLNGSFFACPDLLIVRDGTVAGVEQLVRSLVTTGDHRNELRPLHD